MYYLVDLGDCVFALCTPNSILTHHNYKGIAINKKQKEFIEYIFDKKLRRYSVILN